MKRILFLAFIALIAIAPGCRKDPVPGPKGDPGPPGPKGDPGSGNVIGTSFSVNASDWTLDNSNVYYAAFSAPAITYEVTQSGAIMIFIEDIGTANLWHPLPYKEFTPDEGFFSTFSFVYGEEYLELYKIDSDGMEPTNPGLRKFKLVIIEGAQMMAHPSTDWENYEEVKEVLSLE